MGYSIRVSDHRYTEWRDLKKGGKVMASELYRYDKPGAIERVNLAGHPENSELEQRLRKQLESRLSSQGPSR